MSKDSGVSYGDVVVGQATNAQGQTMTIQMSAIKAPPRFYLERYTTNKSLKNAVDSSSELQHADTIYDWVLKKLESFDGNEEIGTQEIERIAKFIKNIAFTFYQTYSHDRNGISSIANSDKEFESVANSLAEFLKSNPVEFNDSTDLILPRNLYEGKDAKIKSVPKKIADYVASVFSSYMKEYLLSELINDVRAANKTSIEASDIDHRTQLIGQFLRPV